MLKLQLSAGKFGLSLTHQAIHAPLVSKLTSFLAPYFREHADMAPDLKIVLRDSAEFPAEAAMRCSSPLIIRKSSSPDFNLTSHSGLVRGRLVAWNDEEQIGYVITREESLVELYCRNNAFFHLIELIRYYGLLLLESAGAVILHSASVVGQGGGAIAIVGAKGAGKTSTLIDMALTDGYQFLSGDKLIVSLSSRGLEAQGWPDYPHVGMRSIERHPQLHSEMEQELQHCKQTPNTDKLLIPPLVFRRHFPIAEQTSFPLRKIVLPDVQHPGAFSTSMMTLAEKRQFPRSAIHEQASGFATATWHGITPQDTPAAGQHDAVWNAIFELPWERWVGAQSQ
jgi:hypothetical protein